MVEPTITITQMFQFVGISTFGLEGVALSILLLSLYVIFAIKYLPGWLAIVSAVVLLTPLATYFYFQSMLFIAFAILLAGLVVALAKIWRIG